MSLQGSVFRRDRLGDLQDARGVEVATYADLHGECAASICKSGERECASIAVTASADSSSRRVRIT